jgi:acetyl-CoA carboxylase biotin carboxyl carrier protein
MAETSRGSDEPLDVRRIHYLVRLMQRYDVTALDLLDGPVQIRLRRRGPEHSSSPPAPRMDATTPGGFQQPAITPSAATHQSPVQPAAATAQAKTVVIESPMVGTYYTSSAPDAPPFVSTGSVVHSETIVGIIEAMKVFTDIPAGVSGTIVEILAKNGQAVEFGQPLFRVIPA